MRHAAADRARPGRLPRSPRGCRRAVRRGRERGARRARHRAARAGRAALRRAPPRRGRARHRQDAARQVARGRDRRPVRPGAVHARTCCPPTSPAPRCTDPRTGEWEFRPGPIFANVVLVDEVNRASPRTQAALLEPMEEHQVTVDGVTHPLPDPFFLVATQNPFGSAGTFPLPESQLDRFALVVHARPARAAPPSARSSTAKAASTRSPRSSRSRRRPSCATTIAAVRDVHCAHIGARLRARRRRRDPRSIPASCSARRRARSSACCTRRRRTRR